MIISQKSFTPSNSFNNKEYLDMCSYTRNIQNTIYIIITYSIIQYKHTHTHTKAEWKLIQHVISINRKSNHELRVRFLSAYQNELLKLIPRNVNNHTYNTMFCVSKRNVNFKLEYASVYVFAAYMHAYRSSTQDINLLQYVQAKHYVLVLLLIYEYKYLLVCVFNENVNGRVDIWFFPNK